MNKMNEKQAKIIAGSTVGIDYKLKSLGTKNGCFVFHAKNNVIIPSDVIVAVNSATGKTGVSMYKIEEAVATANRK